MTHQAKLLAPDGAYQDQFGWSVAIYGDTIVVGAYDFDYGKRRGSANVFVRSGEVWTHLVKLLAPDGIAHYHFGESVAIYGDAIVVGSHLKNDDGEVIGSAHVFVRSGEEWTHLDKLLVPSGAAGDAFGESVAIYEDAIVVGASYDDDNGGVSGSAHVFVRSGENWTYQTKLLAPDGAAYDRFGRTVAIYEDTIVVGAQWDNDKGDNSGSAHVYVRSGEEWRYQAKLLAPDGAAFDWFGLSVTIYEDTVVVGSHYDDDNGKDSGSANIFLRSEQLWTHQAKLLAPDGTAQDQFGWSVAIYKDMIVVGASGYDIISSNGSNGSAYVFEL